jgi:CO dehydrogenase/acetyl-CoA synthase epsilon subunit
LPDKSTSEQIRLEAEKLRETAVKLMEHAAILIAKSAELEKQILGRNARNPSKVASRDHW